MAKKITGYVKLQVPAGAANPSPPIGPALGQRGLNIMEFCKAFNAQTAKLEKNMPIPVTITVYQDRSFTFEMKQAPVSYFIKKAVKIEKGSKTPEVFTIVGTTEADPLENRVSHESPLGSVLMGEKKGAIVVVPAPKGSITYEIQKIGKA